MTDAARLIEANRRRLRQWRLSLPRPNPSFGNPGWEDADARLLIVRLSPWRDVERSTTHQALAVLTRRARPRAYIDFGFFPAEDDRLTLAEIGAPLVYGVQSLRAAADFDLVLVSNSFGLELINLFYWLAAESIPLKASERPESFPLMILGGSNAAAARAVADQAAGEACVDALYFGEAEAGFELMLAPLLERGRPKRGRLAVAAAAGPGLWTPGAHGKPAAPALSAAGARSESSGPDAFILNGDEAHTARLEISRGCPSFCSFCFESWDRKPYREVRLAGLLGQALELKRKSGARELELRSFNFNTHSDFFGLLPAVHGLFRSVNLMSQRTDILARVPYMLEAELAAGKRAYTLGIEGVSERLRRFLSKNLVLDDISAAAGRLLEARVRELKLFFILTAEENEDDIAEFRRLLKLLKDLRARMHAGCRLVFSFGYLVRMPGTPLEFDRPRLEEADWKFALSETKCAVETHGFEFRLAMDWNEYRLAQLFALGGSWLFGLAEELARTGIVYDNGLAPGAWELAADRVQKLGRERKAFFAEKGAEHKFPMDSLLEPAVSRKFLYSRFLAAQACLERPGCFESEAGCEGCGACRDEQERTAILRHGIRPPDEPGEYLKQLRGLVRAKQLAKPRYFVVELPAGAAGGCQAWMEAWLMREAMRADPGAAGKPFELRLVYPAGLSAWYGQALVAAAGDEAFEAEALPAWALAGPPRGLDPEAFLDGQRLSCELHCPAAPAGAVQAVFESFLRGHHLPCTMRRLGAAASYLPSERALKKKILWSAGLEAAADEGGTRLSLKISRRFDLAGLADELDRLCGGTGALARIGGLAAGAKGSGT